MKNILKKTFIGLILATILMLIKSYDIKAYTLKEYNGIVIDEEYIYNKFLEKWEDFDINSYKNIYCRFANINNHDSIECYAFTDSSIKKFYSPDKSNGQISYKIVNTDIYAYIFTYDFKDKKFSNDSRHVVGSQQTSDWSRYSFVYTSSNAISNFNLPDLSTSQNSSFNKFDFEPFMQKPIIRIDYLDNEYKVLKTISCKNKDDDKCSLDINSQEGSYVKVSYYLKELIGTNLDMVQNDTYNFTTQIFNSNKDLYINQILFWFYWGDTTNNIDSYYYLPINQKIGFTNDNYTYQFDVKNNKDTYESIFTYEIDLFYKTNNSYLNTIFIPYLFNMKNITTNEPVVDNPQKPEIDKDDVIIEQNNQMNDKLDDLNSNLTDETLPDTSGYGDVAGWLPPGTIDSLINLPLTLFTTLNNSASETCKAYKLSFINNSTIELPCIGDYLSNLDGWGTLISFIDLAMAVILLYKLLMSLYKDVQKVMSLKDNDSDLGGVD